MKKVTEEQQERMRQAARAELSKRGVMSFRMNQKDLYELLQLACDRRVLAGPMVRDWVVERLRQETDPNPPGPARLDSLEERVRQIENMVALFIRPGKRTSRIASARRKA
jgi:hypothetical protein